MSRVDCPTCGGAGEVPTAETAHLARIRVGGFEHPNLEFTCCGACGGRGHVEGGAA